MSKQVKQTFAAMAAANLVASAAFPEEMRKQLWPLCCGMSILSGFKNAHSQTKEQLIAEIKDNLASVPDFQVFVGEQINPSITLVILNQGQSASPKIVEALQEVGFVKFASATLWSGTGTLWVHSTGKVFEVEPGFTTYATAKAQGAKVTKADIGHNSAVA